MKTRIFLVGCFVVLLTLFFVNRFATREAATQVRANAIAGDRTDVETKITGGVTTLYALDSLARALCFADGKDGSVVQNNEVRNRCSDLDYGNYKADSFSVGIEGGRLGSIVDLGSAADLKQRYGYRETVGNGQGFASIQMRGDKIFVLKDSKTRTVQEITESPQLFRQGASNASAPVKLGNIYLLRLTDRNEKGFQRVVKLQVIAYNPGEWVTIRWQTL